ncbi:hypothetical protein BBF96_08175 [Anoxybacter fermentans]|uniref:HTH lysR-type domain-containing protein n=1 Tax=Anoxybacter fermentans TaxID=1323375 RepID=A0A3S9SYH8_9FIRM|nr:selenium metabolism-associated LysR family transcriptional regulator [Anoxybacter fermentans]AZR73361.1 hypothetical protein BBF96_08175 [Anoxybacter fermentans]
MKISRLYTFVRLAELKSFSLVAEELQLTQPAVSIQIKALEEYFDVRLVKRTSDGVILTPEGEILYRDTKEMLQIWDNLKQKINRLQNLVKGELNIGASTIPGEYLLPELIVGFCQEYPLVELKMEVKDSRSVLQDLLKKKYDLGIVGIKPEEKDIKAIPIASDELVLIVPKDHPFARKGIVIRQEIIKERFILREEGSGTRKAMKEGLAKLGVNIADLQIAAQLGSTEAVIAAVESGLGVSIVSSLAALRAEKLQRLKVIQVKGFQIQRQFYLAYLSELEDKIQVQKFIEYIQNKK